MNSKYLITTFIKISILAISIGIFSPNAFAASYDSFTKMSTVASKYNLKYSKFKDYHVYRNKYSQIALKPEKKQAYFNGVLVFQNVAPDMRWKKLHLSNLDYYKTFFPLLSPHLVPRQKVYRILLDPGHGGKDRGAAGAKLKEKDYTLKLTMRVAAILHACGYKVYLTRSKDKYIPLLSRVYLQKLSKSDLFISIHCNAAQNKNVHGIETYALTPQYARSTNDTGKGTKKRNNSNRFDSNNMLLAYYLQRAMLLRTRAQDRGVKRARFAVLRDINAPGALLEVGFISNPKEENNLANPAYMEKLARGIADGILTYHQLVAPKE
jgi:N-acetylmuramoyl-L-alanine amidase